MNISYNIFNFIKTSIYYILVITTLTKIINSYKNVKSVIFWILIIYTFPVLGVIAWIFLDGIYINNNFGVENNIWFKLSNWFNNLKNYKKNFQINNSKIAKSLFILCKKKQGINSTQGNKLRLINSAQKTIHMLIYDIYTARKNIEMVFYIWQPGGLADQVALALIYSAKRGIYCRLMLDYVGSMFFFRSRWFKIMKKSGIHIIKVFKINILTIFFKRIDIRQHRKIILIDDYIAYTGSMNLVDPIYFKKSSGVGQWLDLMTRMKGPVVTSLGIVYSHDWEIETGISIFPKINKKNINIISKNNKNITQVISSNFNSTQDIIHQTFLNTIYSAKKKIIITTPYLVPSEDLLFAICSAAEKGIDVNIIIPKYIDSILVYWASRYFFTELLESGVKIYQFKGGFLHVKSILIDQQLSLVGTANLDMRSLCLNYEINLLIDDKKFSHKLESIQKKYIKKSKLLKLDIWSLRSKWEKFIEKIFLFFRPLL
ncbi:cardiolipin synthase [Buchnera aphidicola (Taiwanaphis decaspermi)]|uniref:cardiolipin synthase n=1 Tax=Buchnera aphidicola TaxID=9 RepID=UPI0031B7F584